MNFNSIQFIVFLVPLYFAYWKIFSNKVLSQNVLLLISSLIFYGAWDYRFLSLIIISTIVDYYLSLRIKESSKIRLKKKLLYTSVTFNLLLLFIFKYFNFFIDSFALLFDNRFNKLSLNIILPIGISFYTFQTLSYTIDVYKNKIEPTKNWILFAAYISFFPQLVAGPIERANNIFPQLSKKRNFNFDQSTEGIRKILIGFFKKVVIADSLAPIVDYIFSNHNELSSFVLLLGVIYFTFQIYCDFSGYSDIAVGVAKLFGINLMDNFRYPYFSEHIGEFWKRWHISLTNWFRDYLFIPLGGSRDSLVMSIRNVFIVFLVSGFWHGANWTFIFWGLIHAMLYIPFYLFKKYNKRRKIKIPSIISGVITFALVMFGWIFFRSNSIAESFDYIKQLFKFRSGVVPLNPSNNLEIHYYLYFVVGIVLFDLYNSLNKSESIIEKRIFNVSVLIVILLFIQIDISESFIYFQF